MSSGKLDPSNGGQAFCECTESACRVEKPFQKSKPADVPVGFPMAPQDLKHKDTGVRASWWWWGWLVGWLVGGGGGVEI